MKELMIAAALAAIVGGAFAEGYDFKANVKTTKGKYGSQKTTYTVNLGIDDTGTYWWDGLGYANEKEAKADVKKMTNDEKADFAWNALNFDGVDTDYPIKEYYKNRWVWCYTFKFTETDEDCYRVAGSAKLSGIVAMDNCCNTWEFTEYDFGTTVLANDDDGASEISKGLLYRINGVSLNKANKVEVAGTIGDTSFAGDAPVIGTFAYAGQGAFDVKNDLIKNISGNIVGILENPDCESCCDYDSEATVFECEDDDDTLTSYLDTPNGTAAFGTFSLKYNKKYDL